MHKSGTPSREEHTKSSTWSSSSETPRLPSQTFSRSVCKRDIFCSSNSDDSSVGGSDSEEVAVHSKGSQKRKRNVYGDLEESLQEMKSMLKMLCEKVG